MSTRTIAVDPQPTNNAKKLMIVDDDAEMRTLLAEYFRRLGFEVAEKESGQAALQSAAADRFDCFILDVAMPVMNGFEAVAQLRERERAARSRPSVVIGLSSHDDDDTRSRSLRAGFDFYLTKPVTQEDLHRVLRGLSGSAAIHVAPDDAVDAPPDADDVEGRAELELQVVGDG